MRPTTKTALVTKDREVAIMFIQYAMDTEGMEFFLTADNAPNFTASYTKDYDSLCVDALTRNFKQELRIWRALA